VTSGSGASASLVDFGNVHSANEICQLEPEQCYTIDVGGGHLSALTVQSGSSLMPLTTARTQVTLCEDYTVAIPSTSRLCMPANGTKCIVSSVENKVCTAARPVPVGLVKMDLYGDGWGSNVKYVIKELGSNTIIATGALNNGEYGQDSMCFKSNQCYSFTLTTPVGTYTDEIVWLMCGYVGGAPARNMQFCITDTGCAFTDLQDDVWNQDYDDDFEHRTYHPSVPSTESPTSIVVTVAPTTQPSLGAGQTDFPSVVPSAAPTATPTTGRPTDLPTLAPVDAIILVSAICNMTIQLNTAVTDDNINNSPLSNADLHGLDMLFVDFSIRRILEEAGLNVWDASSSAIVVSSSGTDFTVKVQQEASAASTKTVLNITTVVTVTEGSEADAGEALIEIDTALSSANQGKTKALQTELEYSFDMVDRQNLMNGWVDMWKLSSPVMLRLSLGPGFSVSLVETSTSPPEDKGYNLVYPNAPSSSNYNDLHIRAIMVIVGFILVCLILLVAIRLWLSRTKRSVLNTGNDLVIDFDSPRAIQHNPILNFHLNSGGNNNNGGIEMSRGFGGAQGASPNRSGYGQVQSVDTDSPDASEPTQASPSGRGTRTKYARNISDRLLLRNKHPATASSPYTSIRGTSLDVSTRSDAEMESARAAEDEVDVHDNSEF
jgi:hypothetical protein